ncbi:MAG: tetratricopeptide repeat protein, partial [Verrucomicrobiales bacterium]
MKKFVFIGVHSWFAVSAFAAPLDDQITAFKGAAAQTEASVSVILQSGLKEGRSAQAYAAVKPWLSAQPALSPKAMFEAGQVAERAGEWSDAVGFYRKFLNQPTLDATLAAEVVPATYVLLINHLADSEGAYLYMREAGDRLRGYGRARQFDTWFIEQAKSRSDVPALCLRLSSILAEDAGKATTHAADLAWVCTQLETLAAPDEAWFEAAGKLAGLPNVPPAIKARIGWSMAILPFSTEATELFRAKKPVPETLLDKPRAAAAALLAASPYEGSISVARGWMNMNEGHTPNLQDYVAQHREFKTAPLLAALATLSPAQVHSVLVSRGCPRGRPISMLFSTAELRSLVQKIPSAFNSLLAVDVPLLDPTLTVEEARALAPHLARNPHPQAAIIRAIAAAGSLEPELLVPALIKSETWRFSTIKDVAKALTDNRIAEGKVNQLLKDVPEAAPDPLAAQVQASAKPEDRRAAFEKLSKELLSPSPSTSGLLQRWKDLFANAPDAELNTMLKTLSGNLQGEGEMLFRFTLDNTTISKSGRLPWRAYLHGNHFAYHRGPTQKGGADFLAHVEILLRQQMQAGTINETIFGVWLHSNNVGKPESKALFKELLNSPAMAKLNPDYLKIAGDSNLFPDLVLSASVATVSPAVISRELIDLPGNANPAQVEAAFKAVVDRLATNPQPVAPIALHKVAQLPEWSAQTRDLAAQLFGKHPPIGTFPPKQGWEPMVIRATKELKAGQQWGAIEPWAAGLWHAAAATDDERTYDAVEAMIAYAEAALEAGAPSSAMTIARGGLRSTAVKNLTTRTEPKLATMRARLQKAVGMAAGAIGAFEIPVDETDPAFPIYKSQAEFVQGNLDSAWELYTAHAAKLPEVLRQLPVDYSFWLLQRNMETNRAEDAEALIKELTIWSRQAEGTFTAEQDARLRIAYADLALRKGAYPTARAWYRRVADAAEYQGTEMYLLAALGSVKVDRVSKNYSAAMAELDKLAKLTNPAFRSRVSYARAEVLMDQESYQEALDEIETVLRREPKHPDALLLQGRINFFIRKLVEASEIELGPSETDTVIVPGEAVKINLRDPTLRVSGMGADIEVEIWAKSGDRERVMLYQLGDSKDKFRAEIPTALGPPTPGDKALQILGVDEIRFGYSKEFRAKMKDLPADPDTVISVASDAYLAVSAGAFPPREGERKLAIEELGLSTAQAALGTRSVRPGNPVFIRVTDADRSVTSGQDEIAVSITTSSGDEIRQLPLKETSPYSGEFEATVPTSGGQALAFASESAPGRDPNMAISSREYPGWQGEAGKKDVTRIFGVDLNDNAAPGTMTIESGGAGSALTHFVLQTSMSGTHWKTGVRFPSDPAPWDGRPHLSSIPIFRSGLEVSDPVDRTLPEDWKENLELKSARPGMKYLAAYVPKLSDGNLPVVDTGHPGYSALVRYRALFYQPAAAVRRFQLAGLPGSDGKTINTIFLLNGQPAEADSEDPFSITRELAPGLHEIEFWHREGRDNFLKRRPVILCDEPGKQELVPCPDSMFDPASFPEGLRAQLPEPPVITSSAPGKFDVTFGKNTQTRLLRLVIQGFEGLVPTITKVKLTDRSGTALLPVAGDFLELRQNSQLEVLPGDQITVRYIDPVTATPRRERHEGRLTAAFNTGTLTASFLNYEMNKEGERVLVLEPIRRFRHDDAVALVVDDADLDGGPTRDTVDIKIKSSAGAEITIKAVETEDQSGRFIGRVFPVKGQPERDSEIHLPEGGTLTALYRDVENLDPGIPTDRSVTITQAKYEVPGMQAYAMASEALPPPPPSKK